MHNPNSLGKDNYSCLISQRGNQAPGGEVFWDQPPPALPPNTIFFAYYSIMYRAIPQAKEKNISFPFFSQGAKEVRSGEEVCLATVTVTVTGLMGS